MASFSLGRASAVLASGTMVSRVLGFVMSLIFTQTVGLTGQGADAFTVANGLPNTIYAIIAGGALNAVLVPQIVRAGLQADGGRRYIDKLLTLALVVLVLAAVFATLAAPLLIQLAAGQYGPEQTRLAVTFAYWCLPQIFFYGLYTVLGEVLNARGSFGPFTWTPVVNNVVTIAGLFAFQQLFGADGGGQRAATEWTPEMIVVLAGSATLGVALQAILLVFFWKRVGLRYRPDFSFRGVGLGRAGKIAGWTFATLLLTVAAGFLENFTVSGASGENASATALQKAWLVFMLPHSIVAVSIATAYFTKMSGHASRGEIGDFRRDVSTSIRVVGLFLFFSAAALVVCAGSFATIFAPDDPEAAGQMAQIIIAHVIVLPLFSTLAIVQRGFYALDDGRTPFFYTLAQTAVITAGCLIALGLPSDSTTFFVALSISAGVALQALLACVLLRRKLGGWGGTRIVFRFAQYALATLPTMGAGVLVMFLLTRAGGLPTAGVVGALGSMVIAGVAMAVVYFAVLWLLRVPELRAMAAPLLRRLGR